MSWEPGDDSTAVATLREHATLPEALRAVSERLGRDVTGPELRARFRRRGLLAPSEYLARAPAPANVPAPERILFVPDCHHPYVHRPSWDLMLRAARGFRPDRIVILGDFGDFFTVSDHDREPSDAASLKGEIAAQNEALSELDALGATRKHYVEGNHESRLRRHLARQSPELWDFVRVQDLLRLEERGWTWTPYRSDLRIGKLHVTHDGGFAGANAVRQTRARFEGNVVIGHVHRMGVVYEGNAAGEIHVGACFGWLGDRDSIASDYAHRIQKARDWANGFGVGFMLSDGTVHLQACPIVNGTVCVAGEVYA